MEETSNECRLFNFANSSESYRKRIYDLSLMAADFDKAIMLSL